MNTRDYRESEEEVENSSTNEGIPKGWRPAQQDINQVGEAAEREYLSDSNVTDKAGRDIDNNTIYEKDSLIVNKSVSDHQSDFHLETERQIQDAVDILSENDNIRPENWEGLNENERVSTLQSVENEMAEIQGRENIPVISDHDMNHGSYGGYDGCEIHINSDHLMGDKPVEENVDTIIHEGRHAYQDYIVNNAGVLNDNDLVDQWHDNLMPGNYLTAEMYGQLVYENQPIEVDSFSYAERIRNGLYTER